MRVPHVAVRWLVMAVVLALTACGRALVVATETPPAPIETATVNPNLGCTHIEAAPTPDTASLLPPETPADFVMGPADAPVTMLLYCDFQSAQCEIFNRVLDRLLEDHQADLRVVYRPFPVPASAVPALDKSLLSVEAALAAGNQGRFWEMRDLLHAHYDEWVALSPAGFGSWIRDEAAGLHLDAGRFGQDLDDPKTAALASAAYDAAVGFGINSIPTVFINGQLQSRAALSYSGLEATIALTSLGQRQYRNCPPFVIDPSKRYVATLQTEKGDIVIQLYADRAPLAVNSFVVLARDGWFNGTTFHRVIPGLVAEAGDPSGTGSGGPGYYFKDEVYADLHFDRPGVVGMANSGPDTNGSQFFIAYAPQPLLDGLYTIFGQVIAGMDVVESLTPRDPEATSGLPPGDKIISVKIENE